MCCQYFGIVINKPKDLFSNLRFADDFLLFAHSGNDIAKMAAHLDKNEATKYDWKLHFGRTRIFTNILDENRRYE